MSPVYRLFLVAALALPTTTLAQTSFQSRITKSEDCRGGWNSCQITKNYLGTPCRVSAEVTSEEGSIYSTQDSRGANSMGIGSAPGILSGSVTLHGQTYLMPTGRRSDSFTLGGGPFSAYMGEPTNVASRVFFTSSREGAKAYAAIIYIGNHALTCGKIRQQ